MSEHKRHMNQWVTTLLSYLSDTLTGKERNSFEKELEKDLFAAEAFEGLSGLSQEELDADLKELSFKILKKRPEKRLTPYLRIAAGIIIIVSIGTAFFLVSRNKANDFPGNMTVSEKTITEPVPEETLTLKSERNENIMKKQGNEVVREEKKPEYDPSILAEIPEKEDKEVIDSNTGFIGQMNEVTEDAEVADLEFFYQEEDISIPVFSTDRAEPANTVPAGLEKMSARKAMDYSTRKKVRGRVLGQDSIPVPGVIIEVEETEQIVLTDSLGAFAVDPGKEKTMLIAYKEGMTAGDIRVNEKGEVNIMMTPEEPAEAEEVFFLYEMGNERVAFDSVSVNPLPHKLPEMANYRSSRPAAGYDNFRKYLQDNMQYPMETNTVGRAVVILKTVISPTGVPTSIQVVRSPGEAFSREAIRLLKEGPVWIPAQRDGKYLDEETRVRMVFNTK